MGLVDTERYVEVSKIGIQIPSSPLKESLQQLNFYGKKKRDSDIIKTSSYGEVFYYNKRLTNIKMEKIILEIRDAEGGTDAKLLVNEMQDIYIKTAKNNNLN